MCPCITCWILSGYFPLVGVLTFLESGQLFKVIILLDNYIYTIRIKSRQRLLEPG